MERTQGADAIGMEKNHVEEESRRRDSCILCINLRFSTLWVILLVSSTFLMIVSCFHLHC